MSDLKNRVGKRVQPEPVKSAKDILTPPADSVRTTIFLDKSTRRQLKQRALDEGSTMSELIRSAIDRYLTT
ncbi:CopG family transcriptional regulator [Mycobacterium sp. SM1]|uniref:ribbon-helix-helix domain-containing protein n=1 Tax=Mycobacterium sp. SM1 TaxID=2816243 RepID=UPI001BCAF619|nr:CopG family transcriptional regulator [Mycobacterium sp. SM1]MBS4729887.1 CopG family transcriptional regulator [Mycobacterium sp. SM1]